jgi:hypothetical protein
LQFFGVFAERREKALELGGFFRIPHSMTWEQMQYLGGCSFKAQKRALELTRHAYLSSEGLHQLREAQVQLRHAVACLDALESELQLLLHRATAYRPVRGKLRRADVDALRSPKLGAPSDRQRAA